MGSPETVVAHRHFPGPAVGAPGKSPPRVQLLSAGGAAPAACRVTGLTKARWKQLWTQAMAHRRLQLGGSPTGANTAEMVLFFDLPDAASPLGLACRILHHSRRQCIVGIESPPLSWRLAAVDVARALPADGEATPTPAPTVPEPAAITGKRLHLRGDIPCRAAVLAPGEQLTEAVVALRAGFWRVDRLAEYTDIHRSRLLPFLAVLYALGLVVDAPRGLDSWRDPFSFFGLHWSAHDPLVRRQYRRLRRRIDDSPPVAGVSPTDTLEHTYRLLCRRWSRRRLRRQLLSRPAIAEVTDHLGERLELLRRADRLDAAIDCARRLLELDPSHRPTRRWLTQALCRRCVNRFRASSKPPGGKESQ